MSIKELKDLSVPIKVVYVEEGQTEEEAISEEAKSHVEDGSEVYLVVMPKGESLPDDEETKLDGFSVNNTYEAEKKVNGAEEQPKNVTQQVRDTIEKLDVPEMADPKIDPSAVLNVQKATDNYLKGKFEYSIKVTEVNANTYMTLDGDANMGYQTHTVRQDGAIPNNYEFMVERFGNRKAGDKVDMHLDCASMALAYANKEKEVFIAPGKKDTELMFQKLTALTVDNGLVEKYEAVRAGLMDATFKNGEGPEVRRHRASRIDDIILTLTNSSDADRKPYAYGSRIPRRRFPVLSRKKIKALKDAVAAIDRECVVNEDRYQDIFVALQSTDKQLEKEDADYLAHRFEYYDIEQEIHDPEMVTEFLFHPQNAEFAGKITRKQVEDAAYKGAVLPLSNVGETATDFAVSLGMSVTTVSLNGKLANLASASSASKFLHDYIAAMLHKDIWLSYPLVSSSRMYSQFDLNIFMDCLFYPVMVTPLHLDFDAIRCMRNYIYFFLCRPIFDVTDVLDDADADNDLLHIFLTTNPPRRSPPKMALFAALRNYFGMRDTRDLTIMTRQQSHDRMPDGYTSLLESPAGGFREHALVGVLDRYIHRPSETLLYSGGVRNGKPQSVMLNGTDPTVGNKPRVGIWDKAVNFASALYAVTGDPTMKRVIAAVDGATLHSCASVMKKTLETRALGFQHRVNEINYFNKYMGQFGFASPKCISEALNYDLERSPSYKEIQAGSIFSAIALTPVTDLRKVILPDAQQIIDGLAAHSDIEGFLVTRLLVKEIYSPETLRAVANYDRPIKRSDNTPKELLKKAFELYGTKSPVVNAIKEQIEAVTYDYISNWYFPDDARIARIAAQHTLYRKYKLYHEFFHSTEVEYGILPNFWLSKLGSKENINEETNGGATAPTPFRAIRRINYKSSNDPHTETYDTEGFYNRYVQGDDIDAMFHHINAIRDGEAHVLVEIPVNWSVREMSVDSASELSSREMFPIAWSPEAASSVKAKDVAFEYWPSFTVTGERTHHERYTFLAPKYVQPTINPILVEGNRFKTMEDILKPEEEGGHLTFLNDVEERFLKPRPKRKYYNPMIYETTNFM